MKPAHLYVHVPFCARRCSYCDFAVTATSSPPQAAWLDAIERELGATLKAHDWADLAPRTIYVGGGTPSLLDDHALAALRDRFSRYMNLDEVVEWTAEANPESLNAPLAAAWRAAGVTRISLGVQTFHEPSLRWMGRLHGAAGPERAVAAARAAGFEDINVDLIFGLPGRLGRDLAADLERSVDLAPTHVSLYGLTAEPTTPLGGWVRAGRETLPGDAAYEHEYLLAAERLGEAGFRHYEVSNFAKPGRMSLHNGAYWSGAAYLGLGPGAHSYLPPRRLWNLRDWAAYRKRVAADGSAIEAEEVVSGAAAGLERLWLGLRSDRGLALATLGEAQLQLIDAWRQAGWAVVGLANVVLTVRGWLLLDRLAVELETAAQPLDASRRC